MAEHRILADDTLIVDCSRTPGTGSIIVAAIEGELTARSVGAIEGEDAHVWGVVGSVVEHAGQHGTHFSAYADPIGDIEVQS